MHSDGHSARRRRDPTCPRDDQASSEFDESRPAAEPAEARSARGCLRQAAAAAGSSVRAASAVSRATHAAEGLVAAAKDAADRSVALARSGAATATGGLTVTRTAAVDVLQGAADKGAAVVRSGAAGVAAGLAATSAAAVPRLRSGSEVATAAVRSGGAGVAVGLSTAHGALTGFAVNLDWSTIDPTKYLYAGTRGISRGLEEARLVWESIPERLRALGPEEVGKRLEDFDWSHFRPHSQGGNDEASNGIFELASLNRSRGAERMTAAEVQAAHIRKWGVPPSRTELARTLQLVSGSAVAYHLQALERKGWIQLNPGMDRGIQLLREGTPVFDPERLPEVAAGTPILADESKAILRVPDELSRQIHPQADFYVVVRGDSMSSVGYRTGDIIAIKRTPNATDGDIVMVRIGTRDHAEVLSPTERGPSRAATLQQEPRALHHRDR